MKVKTKLVVTMSAFAALAATLLAVTAGGSAAKTLPSAKAKGQPVKVLVVTDLSGVDKNFGIEYLAGIRAAAAYYNAHGGVLGRPVGITVENDNGDPATATSELVTALGSDPTKYSEVFAGESGTITAALLPVLKREKAYSTAINDGGSGVCASASVCPTFFSQNGSAAGYSNGEAQYLAKHYKNVGILEDQDGFNQNETTAVQSYLTSHGVKVEVAAFPFTAVSVTPEMQTLQSGGAQVVLNDAVATGAFEVFSARQALNWNVPVVLDVASASGADVTTEVPLNELNNTWQTAFYCENPANDKNMPAMALISHWARKAGDPLTSTDTCQLSGVGWNTIVMLHDAALKAHSVKSAALVNATNHLNETAKASLFMTYHQFCWTKTNHLNTCNNGVDFDVLRVGRVHNLVLEPGAL